MRKAAAAAAAATRERDNLRKTISCANFGPPQKLINLSSPLKL